MKKQHEPTAPMALENTNSSALLDTLAQFLALHLSFIENA